MSRRVVVTGGSGRVGRAVLAELATSYDVVNADRVPDPFGVEYERVDVLDLDSVRAVTRGADAVIHLAAIDFDWKAPPEQYIHVNTLGSWHVLQAAVENKVERVILCSSISACGLSEMRLDWTPQALPVDERHECRPVDAYGVSKLMIEQMGLAVSRGSATRVICVRPMAVVIDETLADFVSFVDAPDRRWLFYYVTADDLARGFRCALECGPLSYGVFFLSAADTTLDEPTLGWYRDRIGPPPKILNPRLYREHRRASIFSSALAREVLGWEPTSDFRELRRRVATPEEVT